MENLNIHDDENNILTFEYDQQSNLVNIIDHSDGVLDLFWVLCPSEVKELYIWVTMVYTKTIKENFVQEDKESDYV